MASESGQAGPSLNSIGSALVCSDPASTKSVASHFEAEPETEAGAQAGAEASEISEPLAAPAASL